MESQALEDFQTRLHGYLRFNNINPSLHILDQIAQLPKDIIFRLSYESILAEMPKTASRFEKCVSEQPITISGKALCTCVLDNRQELPTLTSFDFAYRFVTHYLANAQRDNRHPGLKAKLFRDIVFEDDEVISDALRLVYGLWLLDPKNDSAPDNAKPKLYSDLDPLSIWAYWSRHFTNPIRIDVEPNGATSKKWLASGFVYDLRSATGFEPPTCDVRRVTRALLWEASLLRIGSIPRRAFVQINFPPFVALVFEEIDPMFVMVEALDAQERSLPIYLYPRLQRWIGPNTGCGPSNNVESFEQITEVLTVMAAAALGDFWVIEDRERTLGPPRISRILGSKSQEKRITYLPRIRYVGGRDLVAKVELAADMTARAAHWRSDHYRKLPDGMNPTKKQIALAKAYDRQPSEGFTWVRGTSVAGVEVERIYRSRSVASVLFDVIPSGGKAVEDLNWFQFEAHCGQWLTAQGFDEVARTSSVDNGVDITAFTTVAGEPIEWIIQCKHWRGKIGPNIVRELEGARKLRGADRAMLIVSSAFTHAAIQTAQKLDIDLVHGDRLTRAK